MIIVMPRYRLRKVMKANRKKTELKCIEELYPDATIIDVTSKSEDEFRQLSPFYPHRNIPVPYSSPWVSACVEAIWQGLKVFEKADIDTALFQNTTMKNLKRLSNKRNNFKYGRILGHRLGVNGKTSQLLGAVEARLHLYAPAYRWVLENKVPHLVEKIRDLSSRGTVILVDYKTNCDIYNDKPLSHAGLIKAYIEGTYPNVEPLDTEAVPEARRESFPVGRRVRHTQFGTGCVTATQGVKVSVMFRQGERVLDLRSDKLEPFDEPETMEVVSNGEKAILVQDNRWLFGVQADPAMKVAAIPCEYEHITFYAGLMDPKQKIPTYYFLVKKEGLWGLLNKFGRQQAPCIYNELKPKETNGLSDGFAFRRGEVQGIIDGKGNETITDGE